MRVLQSPKAKFSGHCEPTPVSALIRPQTITQVDIYHEGLDLDSRLDNLGCYTIERTLKHGSRSCWTVFEQGNITHIALRELLSIGCLPSAVSKMNLPLTVRHTCQTQVALESFQPCSRDSSPLRCISRCIYHGQQWLTSM